jgi:NADH-quinone oxidoreductase subunit N
MAAVRGGFVIAPIVAILFSVISAFYYLRIVKLMYFDEPKKDSVMTIEDISNIKLIVFLIAIFNLVFVVFLDQILTLINNCLGF